MASRAMASAPRGHKYHAIPTELDGIRFASRRESRRYADLRLLEKARQITGLTLQPKFELMVNGHLICKYVADFQYVEHGRVVVEDAKGVHTSTYLLKRKLMKAIHGIEIRET